MTKRIKIGNELQFLLNRRTDDIGPEIQSAVLLDTPDNFDARVILLEIDTKIREMLVVL